jgi:hypothetical protein
MAFAPSPTLFRHFIEEAREQAGSVYGTAGARFPTPAFKPLADFLQL